MAKRKKKNTTQQGESQLQGIRLADLYAKTSDTGKKLLDLRAIVKQKSDMIDRRQSGHDVVNRSDYYKPQPISTQYNYGKSVYDPTITDIGGLERLDDIRAEAQPGWLKLTNGGLKGLGKIVTTAAGLAGTIWGVAQGTYNLFDDDPQTGFWRALWDNPINQALNEIDRSLEEALPNYYTLYEQNTPFLLNSANFWGDKVLKNLGFMVGAFYGGMPVSSFMGKMGNLATKSVFAAARAKRAAQTAKGIATSFRQGMEAVHRTRIASKHITSFVGSLTSAMNEGAVEAVSNTHDFAELKYLQYLDQYKEKEALLKVQYAKNPKALQYELQKNHNEFQNRMRALEQERIRMGNADYMLNIGILTANNLNMFGKLYRRGFQHSLREFNILGSIKEGYKPGSHWAKGLAKGLKNAVSEGSEEYLQRAASDGSGNMASKSLEQYIDASKKYKSNYDAWDTIGSFAKSISDNMKDPNAWEEFAIGAISAMVGMPVFGANTRNAWTGHNNKAGLSGGIIGEIMDAVKDRGRESTIAEYMNTRVKDPKFRALYKGMVSHMEFDKIKQEALKRGDKKAFEEAEWDQFFTDVTTWAAAGKLGQFKELLDFTKDYSDKELEGIVDIDKKVRTVQQQKEQDAADLQSLNAKRDKILSSLNTAKKAHSQATKEGRKSLLKALNSHISTLHYDLSKVEGSIRELESKINDGSYEEIRTGSFYENNRPMTESEAGREKMREILEENNRKLSRQVDDILAIVNEVDLETQGLLNEEQTSSLAYLKAKIYNSEYRASEAEGHLKNILQPILSQRQRFEDDRREELEKLMSEKSEDEMTEDEKKRMQGVKQTLEQLQKNNELLRKLFNSDTETIQSYLLNPGIFKELVSMLTNLSVVGQAYGNDYTFRRYSSLEMTKAVDDLFELQSLAYDKLSYNKLFVEYLKDPTKLQDNIDSSKDRVTDRAMDQQADMLFDKLKNVTTFSELSKIMTAKDMDQEIIDRTLQKIKESGSKELQDLADQFNKAHKAFESLMEIVSNDKTLDQDTKEKIFELLDKDFSDVLEDDLNDDKVKNFQERLKQLVDDLDKTNPELSKKLDSVLKHYERQRQSNAEPSKVARKRSRTPKPAKKKKKASASTETTKESIQEQLMEYWDDVKEFDSVADIIQAIGSDKISNPEIRKAIDEWNSKHPDDLISDDWIAGRLQEYLDKLQLDDDDDIQSSKHKEYDASCEDDIQSKKAAEMSANMKVSFNSSRVTEYRISNEDGSYTFVQIPYDPTDPIDKRIQEILKERKAYEFVDRGYLGTIFQNDPGIDVYYLKSHEPGVSQGATFLAIEWTDDLADLIKKKHFNGKGSVDLSQYVKPVSLTFKGETKRFVLIGSLGVVEGADESVVKSYANQESLLNAEYKKNDEDFFISESYQNKIDTVNTGRLSKQPSQVDDEGNIVDAAYVSLDEWVSQATEWGNGNGKSFDLRVIVGNDVEEDSSATMDNMVKPNSAWLSSHSGAVLLFVQRPDGKSYPIRCTRKSVAEWLMESNSDFESLVDVVVDNKVINHSPYLEKIIQLLKDLVDPDSSFGDKIKAKMELRNFLILGQMSNININDLGDSYEVQIFGETLDKGDVKANIIKAMDIMADNQVIFTVPTKNKRPAIKDNAIISARVLKVGLDGFYNFNANFSIKPTNSKGEPLDKATPVPDDIPDNNPPQQETFSTEGGFYDIIFDRDSGAIMDIVRQDKQELGQHEYKSVEFFVNASRGRVESMYDQLRLSGDEYDYFKKVYYDEQLGIMYDANKTGNNRQLTTDEAVGEVLDKKKKIDRSRRKKAEKAAAKALQKKNLSNLAQHNLDNGYARDWDILTSPYYRDTEREWNGTKVYTGNSIGLLEVAVDLAINAGLMSGQIEDYFTFKGDTTGVTPTQLAKIANLLKAKNITTTRQLFETIRDQKSSRDAAADNQGGKNGEEENNSNKGKDSNSTISDIMKIVDNSSNPEDVFNIVSTQSGNNTSGWRVVGTKQSDWNQGYDSELYDSSKPTGQSYWVTLPNGASAIVINMSGRDGEYKAIVFNGAVSQENQKLIDEILKEDKYNPLKTPDKNTIYQFYKELKSRDAKPPTAEGQQSHWFDGVVLDADGNIDVEMLLEGSPIYTEILKHTKLDYTKKPIKRLLNGLSLAEQTGKINLNDQGTLQEIADMLRNNGTIKELNKAVDFYLHDKLCL